MMEQTRDNKNIKLLHITYLPLSTWSKSANVEFGSITIIDRIKSTQNMFLKSPHMETTAAACWNFYLFIGLHI